MKRVLFMLAAAAATLVFAAAAHAKGPSAGTIHGPGLGKGLALRGPENKSSPFFRFVEAAGFFPAVFPQSPDPMLSSRPTSELGPKYTIDYTVPGPEGQTFRLTQALYPYADGGPVTYMRPGQPVFAVKTRGGWFRSSSLTAFRTVGFPGKAPSVSGISGGAWAGIGVGGLLALAAGAFLMRRRAL